MMWLRFEREIEHTINLDLPGIYEWRIEGVGSYIGKSRHLRRRLREYPNNIRKLQLGLPYRKHKPTEFRLVHHELHRAHVEGRRIVLSVIENCASDTLADRERHWITLRGTLNR
jgi:hypothetical protein